MSSGLLIFYGIAIAIILGGGLSAFLLLRRRSLLLAVALGLFVTSILVLLCPIPIHGGFMVLGEAIFDEWSRDRQRSQQVRTDQDQQAYLDSFSMRFTGELPILGRDTLGHGWQTITYAPGRSAWLDTVNGQVWSEWLMLAETPSLHRSNWPRNRCRQYPPAGYWSLPTEAEHALMWKSGGFQGTTAVDAGSVSFVIDADFRMEIATYDVGASSNSQADAGKRFAVHCVARGPGGPARGFIKRDVAIGDWNRYQLSKSR